MISTLVVLARSPHPGRGKTRLRRDLLPATVDTIARAMVVDTLTWAAGAGFDRLIVAHRGAADRELRRLAPRALWLDQPEGDLGARIDAALAAALDGPTTAAVQIGTDSPSLPAGLLEAALEALERAPSSLVPADDGGWIALGATRALGGALGGVPWGSEATQRSTVRALTAAGMAPTVLASHYDIDVAEDLVRLAGDPGAADRAPRTLAAIAPLLRRLDDLVAVARAAGTTR